MNKSFYKKWWFWLLCIFIVLFILNYSIKSLRTENENNKTTVKQEQIKNKEEMPKAELIDLNKSKSVDDIEYKILNVKETKSISNESGKSKANGKFIIVELQIENKTKNPISYSSDDFFLINNGRTFLVDDNSFNASQNLNSQQTIFNKNEKYIGTYDKFNPGITKKTFIVFDVPKDLNIKDTCFIPAKNTNIQFKLYK